MKERQVRIIGNEIDFDLDLLVAADHNHISGDAELGKPAIRPISKL